MLTFHSKHNKPATIMAVQVDEASASSFGQLVADDQGVVSHFVCRPESLISTLINGGVYALKPEVLSVIAKHEDELVAPPSPLRRLHSEAHSMMIDSHLLVPLTRERNLVAFRGASFWRQIKDCGAAVECNEVYLGHLRLTHPERLADAPNVTGNVIIHPTAKIDPTALIGPNVHISAGAVVGRGARIRDSIVLDNVSINDHAVVLKSIIGWDSVIGHWARIEGVPAAGFDLRSGGYSVLGIAVNVEPEVMIRRCIVLAYKQLGRSYCNEVLL